MSVELHPLAAPGLVMKLFAAVLASPGRATIMDISLALSLSVASLGIKPQELPSTALKKVTLLQSLRTIQIRTTASLLLFQELKVIGDTSVTKMVIFQTTKLKELIVVRTRSPTPSQWPAPVLLGPIPV